MRQFSRYLSELIDHFQSNEETFDVYPNRFGPIVRNTHTGQDLVRARWGMPSPPSVLEGRVYDYGVTNIRNTSSPHWRGWLLPEHRCLVPVLKFAEPDPASKRPGQRVPDAWFAKPDNGLFFFAGIWTRWSGKRMAREEPATHELFAFLTTGPNTLVGAVHPKAMPVILTDPAEVEIWLRAPWEEARDLQRPLTDGLLTMLPSEAPKQPSLF